MKCFSSCYHHCWYCKMLFMTYSLFIYLVYLADRGKNKHDFITLSPWYFHISQTRKPCKSCNFVSWGCWKIAIKSLPLKPSRLWLMFQIGPTKTRKLVKIEDLNTVFLKISNSGSVCPVADWLLSCQVQYRGNIRELFFQHKPQGALKKFQLRLLTL